MNASPEESSILETSFAPVVIYLTSLGFAVLFLMRSLQALYARHKNRCQTPAFIIFLLINVLLQLVFTTSAILISMDITCTSTVCILAFTVFKTADLCGLYLHQLVALESVLSLRYPLYSTDLFSLPSSVALSVSVYLLAAAGAFTQSDLAFCLPSIGILTTTIVFTCKTPSSQHDDPVTPRKPAYWVLTVAMVTVIVAYLPNFVIMCLTNWEYYRHLDRLSMLSFLDAHYITFSMRSLRMIFDTILYEFVCKKILPGQLTQTNTEATALQDVSAN